MSKRGSNPPKLEAVGSDALPLARYSLHLRAPRQSMRAREPPTLRRPRTSTEAERSTASDPSCDADSIPHAPTASTSDRKSTRLNSSHPSISYAVFCLKKKKKKNKNKQTKNTKKKNGKQAC